MARGGIEPPTRGFSTVVGGFRILSINLRRLPASIPGSPRHIPGTATLANVPFVSEYRFLYSRIVKTTLDIDDELLVRAKATSARERKSLTALIEEGLRLRLRRPRPRGRKAAQQIPIFAGKGGLVAGVDPLSNRSVLDAADDVGT